MAVILHLETLFDICAKFDFDDNSYGKTTVTLEFNLDDEEIERFVAAGGPMTNGTTSS